MTIPKKGSRRITINDIQYRWRIRKKYSQDISEGYLVAAVELYENPKSILSIYFPLAGYDSWWGVVNYPITPKYVEGWIRGALNEGWQPDKRGDFKIIHKSVESDK